MSRRDVDSESAQICGHILDSEMYRGAQYIYAYYPLGNEVDVRLVAQTAWQEGKHVAFPKVFGDDMRFFEVTDFGQLAEGAFGVMEPDEDAGAIPVDWMSETGGNSILPGREPKSRLLVLVPGIAFDMQGNRMGHGKGYYDRYFAQLTGSDDSTSGNNSLRGASVDAPRRVSLLGVAYSCQIAERLPAEKYDLTVPCLVMEKGIFLSDQS